MSLTKLALEFAVIDGGSRALRGITDELDQLGEGASGAGRQLEAMAESWAKGLAAMATAGTIKEKLIDPGLEAAADLQEALANLQVNLDQGSVDQMQRTLASAQADAARVAGPTRFSQEEVIGVQAELKKAGLGVDTILGHGGAAEAVAKLATGEKGLGIDQSQSAVVTMGSIFGLAGSQYAGAADILSRAGSAAASDPARLAQALAQAPSAGTMGLAPGETLASLGVMANMGVQGSAAGTALNAFLRQSAVSDQKYGMGLYGEDGSFLGLTNAAQKLREVMEDRTDQERQIALQKAFGDEGARFALGLLRTGSGGLESVLAGMEGSRSLDEKVGILAGTQKATAGALAGTSRTALANLYSPLLGPMTALTTKANEAVGSVAVAAQQNEGLAKAVSYGSAGAAIGAAGLGAAYFLRGGGQGMAALRALGGGMAGEAAGIAKGKAVAAAADITPVYVTNWPAGGLGVGGGLGGAAAGAGGLGGAAASLKSAATMLGKAGLVGAAGVGGYGVGSAIQEHVVKGSWMQDAVQYLLSGMVGFNPVTGFTEAGKLSRRHNFEANAGILEAIVNGISTALGAGMRLDVHVDNENNISWETYDGRTGRMSARGEAA